MKKRIVLSAPKTLDLTGALDMAKMMSTSEESETFCFDFAATKFIEPFAMLFLSSEIQRMAKSHCLSTLTCRNYRHMTYAGHMGFFKAFGLDFGNSPGEAHGSMSYIPLTIYDCAKLQAEAAENFMSVGDRIEAKSRQMSQLLCNEEKGPLIETLTYSIRELMRNVVEHSHAVRFGFCAQYWPLKGKAEVSILDRGIGLRESLKINPHIDASTDKYAINYALMPAVSGKSFKGSKIKQRGPWANSGFGLYMTNRICRNGGNFFIASGDTGMLLSNQGGKRYYQTSFKGTAIRMVMRTEQLPDLREALQKYRDEGELIKNKYKEIVNIDPSSASLMLSEDFNPSVFEKILQKLKFNL